jgi:hypothetical protein
LNTGATVVATGIVWLSVLAPAVSHGAFERAPLDAWSAALGGVVAVSSDAVFGNPAPEQGGGEAAVFELARPFGLRELSEAQAGWHRPGIWSVACGGRRFGTDAYAETEARVALSYALGPVTAGVAPRLLQVGGTGFSTRRSGALDVGLRAEPEPGFVLGATAEAVLGEAPGDPDGRGRRTALGAARHVGPLRIVLEAQTTESTPLALRIGVEASLPAGVRVAAGAAEQPGSVSAGLLLPLPHGRVTVAGAWVPPLGTTLRLGVSLRP